MLDSTYRHAETLIDELVDGGPATGAELCKKLAWSKGRLSTALRYAREHLCPLLEVTIPTPTPDTGWRYQVTQDWQPIEAGAAWTMGLIETRLRGVHRDVLIVLPLLERGSVEWRRANFLAKHLGNITSTLEEIGNGPRQVRGTRRKTKG